MIDYEETNRGFGMARGLSARGLTYDQACSDARTRMVGMGCSECGPMTCAQIAAKVCADTTLFVCPDPIRVALCPDQCGDPPPDDCTVNSTPMGAVCPFTESGWVADSACWWNAFMAANGRKPNRSEYATEVSTLTGLSTTVTGAVYDWGMQFTADNGRTATEAETNAFITQYLTDSGACGGGPGPSDNTMVMVMLAGGAAVALLLALTMRPTNKKLMIAKIA